MIADVNSSLYSLYNLSQAQAKNNYKLSNNKSLQYGSDDSMLFDKINSLTNSHRTQTRIKEEIERNKLIDEQADTALKDVKTAIDKMKELLIKANTSTTNQEGLEAIATEIASLKETIFTLSNTKSNDKYSFSGSNDSVMTFIKDSDGKIIYNGNDGKRKLTVDEGTYKDAGVNGLEAFYYTKESGLKGESVNFSSGDRIVDQDGNEWTFDSSTNTLNKINWDGSYDQISVNDNGDGTFTFSVPDENGNKFDVKDSIFNLADEAINSARGLDGNGNKTLTEEEKRQGVATAQDNLDKYFNDLNYAHSKLGVRNASINDSYEIVSAKTTKLQLAIDEFDKPDQAEIAMKLKELEISFAALYSVISKTNDLSLVNYMK